MFMVEPKASNTVSESAIQRTEPTGMFRSLRHRNFLLLMFGHFFSQSAAGIVTMTQGWLVYDLTNSPFLLGAIGTSITLPILLLSPLTGVIADRVDRCKLLIATYVISMLSMVSLATLILTGLVAVWQVFACGLIFGTMAAFFGPTRQAFIPQLVSRGSLMNAIALHSATNQSTRILGPSIAGGLLASVGAAGCFYGSGLAFAVMVGALMLITVQSTPSGIVTTTIWQSFKEGLIYVIHNRTLSALIAMEAIPAIFGWQYQILMPIFAKDILNVGPIGLGYLLTAAGIGSLAGALLVAALGDFRRKGFLMLVMAMVFGVQLIVFAVSPGFYPSLLILVVVGGTSATYAALVNTLVQAIVPNEFRGRVMGFYMLAFSGMLPLGNLQAGAIASTLGAPASLIIGGTVVVIFSLSVLIFVPRLRQL
ncbi:MAG: MFS transporter [Dehalococcoidia bacterium]|nr:MFS transporter [Dehalococcoidia bacterium]